MKIVIVGNGIIGLTTAFELVDQKKDIDIVVIGKTDRIGSGSLAAGAMLNSFAEVDADTFSSEIEKDRFEMSRAAADMWPRFFNRVYEKYIELGNKDESVLDACFFGKMEDRYTLIVNGPLANSFDDENFNCIADALDRWKQNYQLVDPSSIEGYLPAQRFRATRALKIYDEGWTSPSKFLKILEKVLTSNLNVKLINSNVTNILSINNIISGVVLENGQTIKADKYLIANGASFSELLTRSEMDFQGPKIFYGVGTSLEVIPEKDHIHLNCIRTPNRGLACGTYTVPQGVNLSDNTRRVLLGATNYVSHKPVYNARVNNIRSIFKNAVSEINTRFDKAEVVKINLGWRPVSADTYPLIGYSEQYINMIVCTGTKRDGWHLSPYLAKVLANQVFEEKVPDIVKKFMPNRPLIKNIDRDKAIKKAVKHLISAAYQHEYNPSSSMMDIDLAKYYEEQLKRLHDSVGANDWGIPVDMIGMYKHGHIK